MYDNYYKRYALVGRVGRYTPPSSLTPVPSICSTTCNPPREEQWSKKDISLLSVRCRCAIRCRFYFYISAREKKEKIRIIPAKAESRSYRDGDASRARFQWYYIISSQPAKFNTERGLIRERVYQLCVQFLSSILYR